MAELPDDIARINALTTNARNTWFALLGVLVFVGITLMGVEHIDFYGVGRATKLPLVDVEVPTRYFFIAAPILTAAIYGYFHLYLIRLWDALGKAEPSHEGYPLGDVITPWLVTDAALHLRRWLRKDEDPCTTPRTMEFPAMLLNFALAWAFGLIVLGFLWWQSMPARSFLMTCIAAAALLVCLFTGSASLAMSIIRMKGDSNGETINIWSSVPAMASFLIIVPTVLLLSLFRTELPQPGVPLAHLLMIDEDIVERPKDWLEYEFARKDYRAKWCEREAIEDCGDFGDKEEDFAREWRSRRQSTLANMRRPDWHKQGRDKPDFRKADLRYSFLAGADLSGAQMEGAVLWRAQMEGADLSRAQMERAYLSEAQMEGAVLWRAQMEGAVLWWAQMEGAVLSGAQMERADLRGAQMERAVLSGAQMEGADLRRAQMERADLRGAQMEGADLSRAQMEGAVLSRAQMEGAVLSFSLLTGQEETPNNLDNTNLRAAINNGGALRFVRFANVEFDSKTDFRNVFLDRTVSVPDDFARQMGGDLRRPCQWIDAWLTDERFYSLWRWWVEANPEKGIFENWESIAPNDWRDVPLPTEAQLEAHGLKDCHWKAGPMPGREN